MRMVISTCRDDGLKAKHKVFLSHSGSQKAFVEYICVQLEGCYQFFFFKEFDDLNNRNRWVSCWQKLAMENPRRVNVEKCEAAVKYLHSINGLLYDGLSELRFQKEIVAEICRVVPPEVKYEDSHIQGKLRLCKVGTSPRSPIMDSVYSFEVVLILSFYLIRNLEAMLTL